jgi:hypothetical protein
MPRILTQTPPPPDPPVGDALGVGVGDGLADELEGLGPGLVGGDDVLADGDGSGVGVGCGLAVAPGVALGLTAATTPGPVEPTWAGDGAPGRECARPGVAV